MIRPCRESKTGWTCAAFAGRENQSSYELNEHGPALNVFWISALAGIGRTAGANIACQRKGWEPKNKCPKENEPEGAGTWSDPGLLLSVRTLEGPLHWPPHARTRWVTDRIAWVSRGSPGTITES